MSDYFDSSFVGWCRFDYQHHSGKEFTEMPKMKATLPGEGPSSVPLHEIPGLTVAAGIILYVNGVRTLQDAIALMGERNGDFEGMSADNVKFDKKMSEAAGRAILTHTLTPQTVRDLYEDDEGETVAPSLLDDVAAAIKRRLR